MRQVFVSYARDDRPRVEDLAERLRRLVDGVWFDSQLHGGEDWWSGILERIRECDIFLAVVSPASLGSEACRIEREYAASVNRTIVPVTLQTAPSALPSDIARLQIVDFSRPGEDAVCDLARALLAAPRSKPPPDPLPPAPEAPLSYLSSLVDRVESPRELTMSEQMDIVFRLERGLGSSDHEEREGARQVLQRMMARHDLALSVNKTIDLLARENVPLVKVSTSETTASATPQADTPGRRIEVARRPSSSQPETPRHVSLSTRGDLDRASRSRTHLVPILGAVVASGTGLALAVFLAVDSISQLRSDYQYWDPNGVWIQQTRDAYESGSPGRVLANVLWILTLIWMVNVGVSVARKSLPRTALAATGATLAASVRSLPLVVLWVAAAVVLDESDFVRNAVTMALATTVGLAAGILWARA